MSLDDLPLEIIKARVLNSKESAKFKGVSERQWDRMKAEGKTPPPVMRGKRALGYTLGDLIAMGQNPLEDAEHAAKKLVEAINSGLIQYDVAAGRLFTILKKAKSTDRTA